MPRLSPAILIRAARESSFLPHLLRECRDLPSAKNELRWLAEPVTGTPLPGQLQSTHSRLRQHVRRRSRGEPLQYILGNQPFGQLDILCRPKVLIPRPETEVFTVTLAELIIAALDAGQLRHHDILQVADLCTGTGCIALLLHSMLQPVGQGGTRTSSNPPVHVLGADISSDALRLARRNLRHNLDSQLLHDRAQQEVQFRHLDVLQLGQAAAVSHPPTPDLHAKPVVNDVQPSSLDFLAQTWPIIVSNPPYISPSDFSPGGTTTHSVRRYEPKLALVPPPFGSNLDATIWSGSGSGSGHGHEHGRIKLNTDIQQADRFYAALLSIARKVNTELLVMEIGDDQQSKRVAKLAMQILGQDRSAGFCRGKDNHTTATITTPLLVEIWRDDSSVESCVPSWSGGTDDGNGDGRKVSDVNARAVVVWRGSLAQWRKTNMNATMRIDRLIDQFNG